MRIKHRCAWVLAAVLTLPAAGCEDDDGGKTEAKAEPSLSVAGDSGGALGEAGATADEASSNGKATAKLEARIGGTLIASGDYAAELLAHTNGFVEVVMLTKQGQLIAKPNETNVQVALHGDGAKRAELKLGYDAELGHFVGRVAPDSSLTTGPAEVSAKLASGARWQAKTPRLVVAARAVHDGRVMLVGDHTVELVPQGDMILAYVFDAKGKAVTDGNLGLSLQLKTEKTLDLEWDVKLGAYKAALEGEARLEGQPVTVKLVADGKAHMTTVARFSVDAKTNLGAAADASAGVAAKAPTAAGAAAKADANGALKIGSGGDAKLKLPKPKVEVKANSKPAEAKASGSFSFGTK